MKKILLLVLIGLLSMSMIIGCGSENTTNDETNENQTEANGEKDKDTEETNEETAVETTKFAGKISFKEVAGKVTLDLKNSAPEISEKYDVLFKKFSQLGTFENSAIGAASTANLFYELGIDFIAAPQTKTLHNDLVARQKTIEEFSRENNDILNIGSSMSPNTEALIELQPDIFIFPDTLLGLKERYKYIEEANIEIFPLYQSEYTDIFVILQAILDTTDTSDEKIYEIFKNAKEVIEEANSLTAEAKEEKTVAVLYIKGEPRILEDGMPVIKIAEDLGMINVLAGAEASELSPEVLIDKDPDYIIYYAHGDGDVEALNTFTKELEDENGKYRSLKAVKDGNYIPLGNENYSSFSSVDLRVIEVIKQIVETTYGEE
ncbi:ABC transporter substrate-binding protein [Alkaliphilus pronyensis]|nr:ABC transporter substrate-binding protein [Alkaliphilus pronyensis]